MWSAERWAAEMAVLDLGVATPQTILDALRHGLQRMEDFTAIVFDECHHIVDKDVYAQLLREFYHAWDSDEQGAVKRRIQGLTAAPFKGLADSTHSHRRCIAALANLESAFEVPLWTLSSASATGLAAVAVKPQEATAHYTPSRLLLDLAADNGPDGGAGCHLQETEIGIAEDLLDGLGAFNEDHSTGRSPRGYGPHSTSAFHSATRSTTAYVVAVLGRKAGKLWATHLGVPTMADEYADEPHLSDEAMVLRDVLVSSFDRLAGVVAEESVVTAAAADAAHPSPGVLVFVARRVTERALSALLIAEVTPSDDRIRTGYVMGHRIGAPLASAGPPP